MPADKYTGVGGGLPSHGKGLDDTAKESLQRALDKDGTEELRVNSFRDLQVGAVTDHTEVVEPHDANPNDPATAAPAVKGKAKKK